ncbi:MAG TPA: bifunctional YncE family protein/alkaline phosphatase family protein [Vicinamibacterales bacterium]|nr:bifunctional YncE family protein/alkaline phosphatase family protein [Vicinamibacterales bacterium]
MRHLRTTGVWLLTLVLIAAAAGTTYALKHLQAHVGPQPDGSFVVPTGQTLTPAGVHVEVSDRPLGMILSPDGQTLAVATGSNFGTRSLHIIDVPTNALRQSLNIGNSFVGVDFNPAGDRLYVGGGASNDVKFFRLTNTGSWVADGTLAIAGAAPSGLTLNPDGTKLYVALNMTNQVAVIDTTTRAILNRIPVGTYPYTTVMSIDGSKVYVSNWGGKIPGPGDATDGMFPVVVDPRTGITVSGTVSVIDTRSGAVVKTIETGLHPTGMALSPSGDRLYVTNANSDTISVIDTSIDIVRTTLPVGQIGPGGVPVLGSSPNAVAVSLDGQTLYVANATENAVAVVSLKQGQRAGGRSSGEVWDVRGRIPTGWYPTALALDATGTHLFIGSSFGFGSIAPPPPPRVGRSYQDRKGVVSMIPIPTPGELGQYTQQVRDNNGGFQGSGQGESGGGHPIPTQIGQKSAIKHVFYIIKENRTYDQVFGDLPQGNGDSTLVEFGREVSPNHHALAEQFALLDNYYGPGDQSAMGHRWILQAYPSTWVHKYGNSRNNQSPMLLGPTDAIYDNAKAHGLKVRNYGERGANTITPSNATWTDIYNDWKNGTSNVKIDARAIILGMRDIYHPKYPAAESRVPDGYRADIFLKEFAEFEKTGDLPNLMILLLYDDHTEGTSPGFPTPEASVADNDLALGRIVEAISHSRFWSESAIFVTEDDSQDGLDHVDGHRTVGFVISPYTRRGAVDSTLYTIVNMYRTIEQILGLPPMNGFDSAAEPMYSVFTSKPDLTPYNALANNIPLNKMNPPLAGLTGLRRELAAFSMTIDSSQPGSAPADLLNRAIWHSVKGFDTPYNYGRPETRRLSSLEALLRHQ